MYLRARRFASLNLDPKNLDREADSTRHRFWRSGLHPQVASNRLERRFHELPIARNRVYCQEKYIVGELLVRTDWQVIGGARVTEDKYVLSAMDVRGRAYSTVDVQKV